MQAAAYTESAGEWGEVRTLRGLTSEAPWPHCLPPMHSHGLQGTCDFGQQRVVRHSWLECESEAG